MRRGAVMSSDLPIQHDGRYLRVVLPASELDWDEVWRAVECELEDDIAFAEIIAPSFDDEKRLAEVRGLVHRLDDHGVDSVVEWEGAVPSLMAASS
jgi:hypothetical protein